MIINFLIHHWKLISIVAGAITYLVTHYKLAVSFAKKHAAVFVLSFEVNAAELFINSISDKKAWLMTSCYELLPLNVRFFVSKSLFSSIVEKLYDETLEFTKTHPIDKST